MLRRMNVRRLAIVLCAAATAGMAAAHAGDPSEEYNQVKKIASGSLVRASSVERMRSSRKGFWKLIRPSSHSSKRSAAPKARRCRQRSLA